MEITLNKYTGEAYLNLLRQTLMCRIPVTRPVAFRVGSSNVIDLGDLAEEDTSEFISNVSSSSFVMQGEKELCVWKGTVNSVLSFSTQTMFGDVSVLKTGVKDVLHVLAPVTAEIYFRKGCGKFTSQENAAFLKKHGIVPDAVTAINTRHCAVDAFSYKEKARVGDSVIYDLKILTGNGDTGENLFKQAMAVIASEVSVTM